MDKNTAYALIHLGVVKDGNRIVIGRHIKFIKKELPEYIVARIPITSYKDERFWYMWVYPLGWNGKSIEIHKSRVIGIARNKDELDRLLAFII